MKVTIKRKIEVFNSVDFCTGFDWIGNSCENIWGIFSLKNCKAFKNRQGDDITIRWSRDCHRYVKCKECKDAYSKEIERKKLQANPYYLRKKDEE